MLDSLARRLLGDREGAEAAARHAVRIAGSCGDAVLRARAAEAWVLSISGVGFAIGEAADPELIAVLDDIVATLPPDAVEHQVWVRSMLVSVLVESAQFERQEQLSDEAMAIAERSGDVALMASALYARRLALWRRDRLAERLPIAFDAIEHARRAGDVHLELTAMLVAMSDLMESGRVDEQLAMLDEFERRAATQHTPRVRRVRQLHALVPPRRHGRLRGRRTARRRGAGRRLVVPRHEHRDGPCRADVPASPGTTASSATSSSSSR